MDATSPALETVFSNPFYSRAKRWAGVGERDLCLYVWEGPPKEQVPAVLFLLFHLVQILGDCSLRLPVWSLTKAV